MAYAKTYPKRLKNFCFTLQPPIILSHWDWDHWSSALRTRSAQPNQNAISSTWIVPQQSIGAVHRKVLSLIMKNGKVLIWPNANNNAIVSGPITIHKCTGSDRNQSGLALEFKPHWAVGNGILMTGDCDYSYLPSPINGFNDYDAVVLPHHGGKLKPKTVRAPLKFIPGPSSGGYTRFCISCGIGRPYGHPERATIDKHYDVGWSTQDRLETRNRQNSPCGSIGHIWLNGRQTALGGTFPMCGSKVCQLCFVQN